MGKFINGDKICPQFHYSSCLCSTLTLEEDIVFTYKISFIKNVLPKFHNSPTKT